MDGDYNAHRLRTATGELVRISEGGMPTYIAGDTVRVCVEVKPWATGKGIRRVRATFVHEADPTKKLEISDDPERRSYAQVQTEVVELRGLVLTDARLADEYRWKRWPPSTRGDGWCASPARRTRRSGLSRRRYRASRSPGGGGSSGPFRIVCRLASVNNPGQEVTEGKVCLLLEPPSSSWWCSRV
jgi:hypothetical protein